MCKFCSPNACMQKFMHVQQIFVKHSNGQIYSQIKNNLAFWVNNTKKRCIIADIFTFIYTLSCFQVAFTKKIYSLRQVYQSMTDIAYDWYRSLAGLAQTLRCRSFNNSVLGFYPFMSLISIRYCAILIHQILTQFG